MSPDRPRMDLVLMMMTALGRAAWTEEIVDACKPEAFYAAVYAALRKLEIKGEVARVPHPKTGLRGPVLWRLTAQKREGA